MRGGLMSEAVKKCQRWPWLALATVLLLVGGPLAWQFRPLNETERALIGKWRGGDPKGDWQVEVHLEANRRFRTTLRGSDTGAATGPWTAQGSTIQFKADVSFWDQKGVPWKRRLQRCFEAMFTVEVLEFRADGPDRLTVGEYEYVRVRE